jgi:hypothetical protein
VALLTGASKIDGGAFQRTANHHHAPLAHATRAHCTVRYRSIAQPNASGTYVLTKILVRRSRWRGGLRADGL